MIQTFNGNDERANRSIAVYRELLEMPRFVLSLAGTSLMVQDRTYHNAMYNSQAQGSPETIN